jgi:GntR family transcriptional regulator
MTAHSPQIFSIAASSDPIFQQLVDQVGRYVAAGKLAPGDNLPSARTVALALGVNPMTVSNAYNLLRERGLLESRRGAGMTVANGVVVQSIAERAAQLQPALQRAIREARQLQLDDATVLELAVRLLRADP